jgi:CHAD domain-containing protein
MGYQHLIAKHWEKEKKIFDVNFSVLKKQIDAGAVHDIRVAIKKLRAFFELYTLLKKETEGDCSLNKTEELFDVLGKQSDIQICLELILLYEKENRCRFNELKKYLRSLLAKTQNWVRQSVQIYQEGELSKISVLLNKDSSLQDKKGLIQNIRNSINSQLTAIKADLKRPHKVRQNLKKVYYWVGLLPENASGEAIDIKQLHDIQDELGKWQDNEILLTRIRHFRKDYLPKSFEEASLVKMLEEKLKTKKEEIRKPALNKTKRLLKKI